MDYGAIIIPILAYNPCCAAARVAELVDATDLKSVVRKDVRVQVSPRAPLNRMEYKSIIKT